MTRPTSPGPAPPPPLLLAPSLHRLSGTRPRPHGPRPGHQAATLLASDARTCSVRTEEFDGPLELLLFLVRREGVDVRELRIAPITDAYLAQLDLLHALDLDLAGEFLVMAATLCLLKSRELVPRPTLVEGEEAGPEEDLREELIRKLLEYDRYRAAAEELGERHLLGRDVYDRPVVPLDESERPVEAGVDAMGLLEIFYGVLQRHAEPPPVHEVALEPYSLREMANWLLQRLSGGPRALSDLLAQLDRKLDRVVAFLAALEMARLQLVDVRQSHHLAPIVLASSTPAEQADLSALVGTAG